MSFFFEYQTNPIRQAQHFIYFFKGVRWFLGLLFYKNKCLVKVSCEIFELTTE